MFTYSTQSYDHLMTCHLDIQLVMFETIKIIDCKILCGHRPKEDQDKAFADNFSKLEWPNSKHNGMPSLAIDVIPYPVDYADIRRFYLLAGIILATAAALNIKLRYGGAWSGDLTLKNNTFNDLGHYELIL